MSDYYAFVSMAYALLAGAAIGLERSYHGRAAGMRTYALVCLGSALAILACFRSASGMPQHGIDSVDPQFTRVIQGIVTGVGFLGAGVIVKEGLSVRGLTTAASIWVTAAIGILVGMGFHVAAAGASVLTLVTLSLLRVVEDRLPVQSYLHCDVSVRGGETLDETKLRAIVAELGFRVTEISYRLHAQSRCFEYRLVLWSRSEQAPRKLAQVLAEHAAVAEFRISPSKD